MIRILGLTNTLYFISMILLVILSLFFLYNILHLIYWFYKEHYDKTNTNYEIKNINYYKKKALKLVPILLPLILALFLYKVPRFFDKIVSLEEQNSANGMSIYELFINTDRRNLKIPKDKAQDILKIFKNYKYERYIDDGGSIGQNRVLLSLTTDAKRWIIDIEVWDSGYIRILNNELYKVIGVDNKRELLDKVMEIYKTK